MKLTAVKIKALGRKPGSYGDGGGLYFVVTKTGGRQWVLRYMMAGKSHDMGLGSFDLVSLAEARDGALAARKLARAGTDPIAHRRAQRAAADAARGLHTFREMAEAYIKAHEAGWRSAKHAAQWSSTLETYAYPLLGKLAVSAIGVGEVMRVLEPIWREKPETAGRVRGRTEAILDFATARGWRTGENPARWKGHLANLLPSRAKIAKVQHHAALPWQDIGECVAGLVGQSGMAARALRLLILTAVRSGEVRGATWGEIDLDSATWIIPAQRMKGGAEHRVPLSAQAVSILGELQGGRAAADYVFPGGRPRRPLSDVALAKALQAAGYGDMTVHGFRSTFRDWCGEATNYPREVAEAALAHSLRDKVEAAYRRGDALEKRRTLMAAWADYCTRPAPAGEVVPLRRAG